VALRTSPADRQNACHEEEIRMINAIHTLVYADDAEAARAFFRDVVRWPHVDTGGGWLIFKTGPSEMGVHPTSQGDWSTHQKHEISFVCDDLDATMEDLKSRGATFAGEVVELDFGKTVQLEVPGGPQVMLYEPRYDPPALTL
jgi:predicted enzyme related to lactoylglutathione lyase